jgi:preprotein translocase subunit SecG
MLEILETPLTVIHVLSCLLLVLIVLIQPGKSGGISAALGGAGAQQVFGGRGAGTFLTRGTWILATTFFLTSVVLAYMSSSVGDTLEERAVPTKPAESPAKK